jgi:hypothetical protein
MVGDTHMVNAVVQERHAYSNKVGDIYMVTAAVQEI